MRHIHYRYVEDRVTTGSCTVGHRMGQDGITIIIIVNKYVIVTSSGWGYELLRLVREYLSSISANIVLLLSLWGASVG